MATTTTRTGIRRGAARFSVEPTVSAKSRTRPALRGFHGLDIARYYATHGQAAPGAALAVSRSLTYYDDSYLILRRLSGAVCEGTSSEVMCAQAGSVSFAGNGDFCCCQSGGMGPAPAQSNRLYD